MLNQKRVISFWLAGVGCVLLNHRWSHEYHRARNPSAASSPMPSWKPLIGSEALFAASCLKPFMLRAPNQIVITKYS
ncbi:unnamed protein product [Danaus chrysippus]|uniref:(African queen) hypothetical protein n=1 Tax=Danaus chrysippus TaxID=151541 RepID=A0A8J2R3A9_9NEOP|nr:unnamed protein product [Danaus chrysippus]